MTSISDLSSLLRNQIHRSQRFRRRVSFDHIYHADVPSQIRSFRNYHPTLIASRPQLDPPLSFAASDLHRSDPDLITPTPISNIDDPVASIMPSSPCDHNNSANSNQRPILRIRQASSACSQLEISLIYPLNSCLHLQKMRRDLSDLRSPSRPSTSFTDLLF